ncbi:hypothetical protein D3C78_1926380 [compost metagenome]
MRRRGCGGDDGQAFIGAYFVQRARLRAGLDKQAGGCQAQQDGFEFHRFPLG